MGNEVTGVSTIKFQAQDGALKSFQAREATKDDKNLMSIMEDGKEVIYTKVAVKNDKGENEYKYVLLDGGKTLTPPSKTSEKDLPAFCSLGETKYDRAVDSVFDGMLQIDNTKPCTDGKDDGHISGWDKFKHFCKGCLEPVKAIVKHPIKSLAIAAAATVATIFFPVVGTALLVAGLAMGIATIGYGAYKAASTKTDAEARAAWENIGTGTITTILSAIGLKKAHTAAKAKSEAFPTSKKYGTPAATKTPDKPATDAEISQLWKTTCKENRRLEKLLNMSKSKMTSAEKAQLKQDIAAVKADWLKARDAWASAKSTNPTSQVGPKLDSTIEYTPTNWRTQVTPEAPKTTNTTNTPEYTGIAKKLQGVGTKVKNGYESVKTAGKEMAETFNPKTLDKTLLPQGDQCMTATVGKNRFDGLGTQLTTRAKALGFHDVTGKKMSDVEALSEAALKHIHDGHHWQAKDAINYMQQIVKAGKLNESETSQAQTLIDTATTLLGKTKAINTTPGIKSASVIVGNGENMADNSATEYADFLKGAYTFS